MCRKWRRSPTSWSFLLKWQLRVKKDQVRVIARRGKLKTMGTDTQAQCNFFRQEVPLVGPLALLKISSNVASCRASMAKI